MQQINLYLPEFRRNRDWLTAMNSALAVLALVLVLGLLFALQVGEIRSMKSSVLELEQKSEAVQAEVKDLKSQPRAGGRKMLEQEIAALREAIAKRQVASHVISGRAMGNRNGFSHHMKALGQYLPEGVTLNEFTFHQGGSFVRLRGWSVQPEHVPLYISRLQEAEAFSASRFGNFTAQADSGGVEFSFSGDGASENVQRAPFRDSRFQK